MRERVLSLERIKREEISARVQAWTLEMERTMLDLLLWVRSRLSLQLSLKEHYYHHKLYRYRTGRISRSISFGLSESFRVV